MNELIRQLADEAGLKYYNWITNESNINDGDFKYPRLEDYEKFAELIVQDCLTQVAMIGISNFENDDHGDISWTVSKCIEMIKHRFEIKE
jgi:hypothetical protein